MGLSELQRLSQQGFISRYGEILFEAGLFRSNLRPDAREHGRRYFQSQGFQVRDAGLQHFSGDAARPVLCVNTQPVCHQIFAHVVVLTDVKLPLGVAYCAEHVAEVLRLKLKQKIKWKNPTQTKLIDLLSVYLRRLAMTSRQERSSR